MKNFIKGLLSLAWALKYYFLALAFMIVFVIFSYFIKYQVAISNLPDWFKFALLK